MRYTEDYIFAIVILGAPILFRFLYNWVTKDCHEYTLFSKLRPAVRILSWIAFAAAVMVVGIVARFWPDWEVFWYPVLLGMASLLILLFLLLSTLISRHCRERIAAGPAHPVGRVAFVVLAFLLSAFVTVMVFLFKLFLEILVDAAEKEEKSQYIFDPYGKNLHHGLTAHGYRERTIWDD